MFLTEEYTKQKFRSSLEVDWDYQPHLDFIIVSPENYKKYIEVFNINFGEMVTYFFFACGRLLQI